MMLKPLRDKNGKIVTNRLMLKIISNKLKSIKEEDQKNYFKILGGSKTATEIEEFLNQFNNCKTDEECNIILRDFLLK